MNRRKFSMLAIACAAVLTTTLLGCSGGGTTTSNINGTIEVKAEAADGYVGCEEISVMDGQAVYYDHEIESGSFDLIVCPRLYPEDETIIDIEDAMFWADENDIFTVEDLSGGGGGQITLPAGEYVVGFNMHECTGTINVDER